MPGETVRSATRAIASASARELASTSARELIRSGFTAGVMVFMFASFVVVLLVVDAVMPAPGGRSFLEQSIGIVPAMGFLSLALVGTAVPLVDYRDRGTLVLLGTTPLGRRSILLGQLPVRVAIAAIEGVIVLVLMGTTGGRTPIALASAAITLVCGAGMFLALGLLVGARGRNVDAVMQIGLLAPVMLIATSGAVIPFAILPDWLAAAFSALPTTWFVMAFDSAVQQTWGEALATWGGLLAVAALALLTAIRLFDWGVEKPR